MFRRRIASAQLMQSTAFAQAPATATTPAPAVYTAPKAEIDKIRGVYMQGNAAVKPYFEAWLSPFGDLGAKTLTISNTGGTDHLSFDAVGLPGFQFIQDAVEYNSRTHHSNQDVFDRIQADDMKQAATIMAAFVYQTAMMDEKLPRKNDTK